LSNIYKGYYVSVEDEKTRVVDSNELVKKRMEEEQVRLQRLRFLSEELGVSGDSENSEEGFVEGLGAVDISSLVDEDNPDGVNIIQGASSSTPPSKEEQELAEILSQIENAKAELESVKNETDSYMQNAQAELDRMSKEAYEEAKENGYREGHDLGLSEVEGLKAEYQNMIVSLENEYQQKMEELEPLMVSTLSGVYEKFFKIELGSSSTLIMNLLSEAMNDSGETRNIVVHINQDDFQSVLEQKDTLLAMTGMSEENVEFIQDATLGIGGCMVETDNGVYDCSLETELKELRNKLMLISRS